MSIIKLGAIPFEGLTAKTKSAEVVQRLRRAFLLGLRGRSVPEALIERFSVAVPGDVETVLLALSKDLGVSPAIACAMVLAELSDAESESPKQSSTLVPSSAPRSGALEHINPALWPLTEFTLGELNRGQIVFAEAATGTGKGRMIAGLAKERASSGLVLCAAPLPVCKQLLTEFQIVAPELNVQLLLGRPNFVDPDAVDEWLADHPCPALAEWMENGAPPITPETQALARSTGTPLAWLLEDALSLVPPEVGHDWYLRGEADSESPAEQAYRALRCGVAKEGVNVVMCSHTMLAIDVFLQTIGNQTVLPAEFGTLIIDEAHIFEQAMASVNEDTIYFSAIPRHVRSAHVSRTIESEILDAVGSIESVILNLNFKTEISSITTIHRIPEIRNALLQLHKSLSNIPKSSKRLATESAHARARLSAIRLILSAVISGKTLIRIDLSKIRKHPSMTVGRASLVQPLETLFARAKSAALVSATLYLPDQFGAMNATYSRWVLSVPKERVATFPPVIPKWVNETPELHYCFSSREPDDSDEWITELAEQTRSISQSAKGGTLVLLTSYLTSAALVEKLLGMGLNPIVQTSNHPSAMCIKEFRSRYANNEKPLWLGVGNAWTGIDLSDKSVSPENDFLLTDLFIPRIPFEVNRTMTHARRAERVPAARMHEATRVFRQGIGRLVRRNGVSSRRIWIGDSRLSRQGSKMFSAIKKLLVRTGKQNCK